jgi:PhoPQ-activated pathogenicity-related protein
LCPEERKNAIGSRKSFEWFLAERLRFQIKAETHPIAAALWQAANPVARDFRLEAIGLLAPRIVAPLWKNAETASTSPKRPSRQG